MGLYRVPRPVDTDHMPAERLRGISIVWRFAITSLITRRLGGEVAVDSVVGHGSTFTVTIPVPAPTGREDPQNPEMARA